MKIYSKLLGKIRKNKARIKKTIRILILGVGIRYGNINSSPINLRSNSTQQIERVDTFVEEHTQDGKIQEALSHKSSSHLIKTGSGVLIGNKWISEYSKSALEIRSGDLVTIVNATDNSFITVVNATESQLKSIQEDHNFGLDTRPSMQLTLRLRGPKNHN